ncbi:sulfatase [Gayadomonas joobiniege]|uniref:sulfatase n=1 Tax=Gayadomonas joobiniege TaxID=1234606 RepID=UPI00036DC818|nr:sulfatase [Gayadomonas joobiniege]
MRINILKVIYLILLLPSIGMAKPNILMILVDDLGWQDTSAYGGRLYQTPNIDKLAKSGVKFNQAYAAAHICSPTRMSILTGQYPARLQVTDWIPGWSFPHEKYLPPNWNQQGLSHSMTSIGEVMQAQGYKTAWLGKWHVRGLKNATETTDYEHHKAAQEHGFDAGEQDFRLNGKLNPDDPKGVLNLSKQAIEFIEQQSGPWFATISHYSVHTPVHFNPTRKQAYLNHPDKAVQAHAGYAAMLDALDHSVGYLLNYLQASEQLTNTVIIFTSDNGGLDKNDSGQPTDNAPLKNGKATLFEGGIRVPFIVSWPNVVSPGTESEALVSSIDILPTVAAIAGNTQPQTSQILDGINLLPILKNEQIANARNTLFWHYPHYHRQGGPASAIRQGHYKLIQALDSGELYLYNLAKDIGEQKNLANSHSLLADQLLQKLQDWRQSVGAQALRNNPNYNKDKAKF